MRSSAPFGSTARQLLGHTWPVLVAQLLSMSMMVADTTIAAHYGTTDLAAVAVGNGLYVSVLMLLVGILQSVAPTVAHLVGGGRHTEIGATLQQGFWLALLLAVPGTLILVFPQMLLELARVPPDTGEKVSTYLRATAAGLPAILLYRTFYAFNNAVGRPRALMAISLIASSIHVPLAWALTNGHLGIDALGATGCGVSTSVVAWISLCCGISYLSRNPAYRTYLIFHNWRGPRAASLFALLRLGLPMGMSTFIEITSFTLIALFVARLGAEAVAGHRIVANLAALVYMLPLSLSTATLVLVGQAAGAHDWQRARTVVRVGLLLSTCLATLVGILLWFAREPLMALSTDDVVVRAIAIALLPYICLYQLFDAAQTVASHALRGYKVTLLPMALHTLCFWGVGLGCGYWLSFHAGERSGAPSVAGFWEGGVLATILASILFGGLLRLIAGRESLNRA
ncbi:MATE family efflux transporter [Azoarcus sp. DD4]|uniref:MATE family efflux transporter n=1 Tax=Azoarcus sp. DD4 TaxID=2027405 RepID=UPI001127E700|nr:MATE family efflux transporter [Azoarcus sp. DD4]QDF97419.1 MATE family efflux transporter [Azoarcus sp. DD4]